MTTAAQTFANRRNARASTGPRSKNGKARSSRNAKRHGLTSPPHEADIARWWRIITNDELGRWGPDLADPVARAALRLAEAETHLERVHAHQARLEAEDPEGRAPAPKGEEELLGIVYGSLLDAIENGGMSKEDWDFHAAVVRFIEKVKARRDRDARRERRRARRLAERYRREAEARRRRALKLWIAVNFPETKPNSR